MVYKVKDVILLFFAMILFIGVLGGGGWYMFICMSFFLFFSKKLWGKYLASFIYKKIIISKMNSTDESEAVFHYSKKIYVNGKSIFGSQMLDYFDVFPYNIAKWTYENMDNKSCHYFYELTSTGPFDDRELSVYIIINESTHRELENSVLLDIKQGVYNRPKLIKVKGRTHSYIYASQIQ